MAEFTAQCSEGTMLGLRLAVNVLKFVIILSLKLFSFNVKLDERTELPSTHSLRDAL